jgi:hypothetical protein
VSLAQYEANLKEVVARLRADSSAALVFVNTTPILDDRHARRGAGLCRPHRRCLVRHLRPA